MYRKIILLISLVLKSFVLFSEVMDVDIETALKLAKENNSYLKQSKLDLDYSRHNSETFYNKFYPELTVNSNTSQPLKEDHNARSWISLDLDFSVNPIVFSEIKELQLQLELEELDYSNTVVWLDQRVKRVFYNLIKSKNKIDINEEYFNNLKVRYEDHKSKYESGSGSKLDYLESRVTYESFKSTVESYIEYYKSVELDFKTVLGIEHNVEINIIGNLESEIKKVNYQEVLDSTIKNNVYIKYLMKNEELTKQYKQNYFLESLLPRFSFGLKNNIWIDNNDVFGDGKWLASGEEFDISNEFENNPMDFYFRVYFDLAKLIPNSNTNNQIKRFERDIEKAKISFTNKLQTTKEEVIKLTDVINSTREKQERLLLLVDTAKENLDEMNKAYVLRQVDITRLHAAEFVYKDSKQQLLEVKYDYLIAVIDLQALMNEK